MSKKTIFILATTAILLFGCGRKDPKIYSQDGPVADGDIMVETMPADAAHLNPAISDENVGLDLEQLMFEGLLRFNDKFELEPCLAERWTVSKDGKVITFYLRKGVKWHDGVEFTAADVLFTYKVFTDPATNTPYGSLYQDIKEVDVVDPYTVRVYYKKIYAPALALNFNLILPKHCLEGKDINKDPFDRHPIGTGPYQFKEWKAAQQITLEAYPDYWGGKPHIKKFIMRIVPDEATAFLEMLNGGIDAIGCWLHGQLTPEQFTKQSQTSKFKDYYNAYRTNSLIYIYIGWNEKNPLFKEKKVRQALTMAIDRESIIQNVIYGLGAVANGPFPTQSWANNPKIKPWPFDQAKARKALKEAGWKTGSDGMLYRMVNGVKKSFEFKLLTNQGNVMRERIATIVQQQLKQVGIKVDIQIIEWTTFLSQYMDPHKFDAIISGWIETPDPGDAYQTWHSSQTGEHQFNYISYKNSYVDQLLIQGLRTFDRKKRQKIYWQIHSIINQDQPYTFLYVPDQLSAIHKRFKGYKVTSTFFDGIYFYPEKWYVPANQQKYNQ